MKKEIYLFASKSCNKCKGLKPKLDELMSKREDVTYTLVSIDDKKGFNLALDKEVISLPTVIFYIDDKEKKRFVSDINTEEIESLLIG